MPRARRRGPLNHRSGDGQYSVTSVFRIHRGCVSRCVAGGGGGGGQAWRTSAAARARSTPGMFPDIRPGDVSRMLEKNLARGIHRVEDSYTNWYLVEDGDRLTIVDAGVPTSWKSLLDALRELGRRPADVDALVLTHAHFDHIGMAERARRELGVPVWVHENDVPLTHHPRRYAYERSPAYYFATQVRALPIVAALVRDRAFWPRPVQEVRRYENGS